MNIFARTLGGIFGDNFGSLWGLKGRAFWLFICIFCEGLALMLFSQMTVLLLAIPALVLFSLFVQMSEGATFSVVPFINKKALGAVAGERLLNDLIAHATQRKLNCRTETAFEFLATRPGAFDVIVCEQELNHLTKAEMIEWLKLCRQALRPGGTVVVYGLNGANPITGPDALAHNMDHFHTFTDYSLGQALELAGFEGIQPFPLELYVFYKNPLNYVGLAITGFLHFTFRIFFTLYGKKALIFTKKLGASARRGAGA